MKFPNNINHKVNARYDKIYRNRSGVYHRSTTGILNILITKFTTPKTPQRRVGLRSNQRFTRKHDETR